MAVAYGVMALAALDLVLFADVLTSSSGKVPAGWDVELHARLVDFAADNIRRGHLPLWNPHLFSGMPALGDPNARPGAMVSHHRARGPGGGPAHSTPRGVRDVLAALDARDWDPTRTVLLESEPDPPPVAIAPEGAVTLRDESTDHLTIVADLPAPAILLVTDAYSRGWHVRSLEPSDQKAYEVLPANAVLRAVPLAAGHHLIRMEYVPDGYRFGVAVSCLAIGALGVAILRAWTSRAGAR
jgi:hypothetical protein